MDSKKVNYSFKINIDAANKIVICSYCKGNPPKEGCFKCNICPAPLPKTKD
jgi:hypothetical protein